MPKSNPDGGQSDPRRNSDLGLIHIAAKALFGDVSRGVDGRDDYEAWLERMTGARSSGKLSRQKRIDLCKYIREKGLAPERTHKDKVDKRRGGKGPDRPTARQYAKMAGLARELGMDSDKDTLDSPRLLGFVRRTAKVSALRFMTRHQASQVILGLEKMQRQQEVKPVSEPKDEHNAMS